MIGEVSKYSQNLFTFPKVASIMVSKRMSTVLFGGAAIFAGETPLLISPILF